MRSEGSRRLGALDITNRQIASRLGVSAAIVSAWISGERTPGPEKVLALKRAFGIPVTTWPRREDELLREVFAEWLAELVGDVLAAAGSDALLQIAAAQEARIRTDDPEPDHRE